MSEESDGLALERVFPTLSDYAAHPMQPRRKDSFRVDSSAGVLGVVAGRRVYRRCRDLPSIASSKRMTVAQTSIVRSTWERSDQIRPKCGDADRDHVAFHRSMHLRRVHESLSVKRKHI